ncbi:MAG: ATP-binding protein, partial [Actinomycetes bacterium]
MFSRRAQFPGDAGAPTAARRFVRAMLAKARRDDVTDDAVLLASELCENAVLHAGTGFTIELVVADGGAVTVTVTDQGTLAMELRRAGQPDGRGLALIAGVADAWGTRHDRHGHQV